MSEDKENSPSAADIVDGMADDMGIDEKEEESADTSEPEGDGSESTVEMDQEVAAAIADSDGIDDETRGKLEDVLSEAGVDADNLEETIAELSGKGSDEEEDSEEDPGAEADSSDEEEADAEEAEEAAEAEEAEEESDEEPDLAAKEEDEEADASAEPTPEAAGSTSTPANDHPNEARWEDGTIGGIFDPEDDSGENDLQDPYLDEDDLDGYAGGQNDSLIPTIAAVVLVLTAGTMIFLVQFTKQGERIVHLFEGDLKEYEMAQAKRIESKFKREQLKNLPKFGTLKMSGKPKYSLVKLDGEVQWGKTPKSGEWKRLRLTPKTSFQNLDIKEKHTVEVSAPHRETETVELTEGRWQPVGGSDVDFQQQLRFTLIPTSFARQIEFHQRLEKNPENEFFGEVTINSKPEGAEILFGGKPLLNEEGEEMTTPVTFEKYYYKDEKKDELVEKKVKVDMPPDRGHKIQLRIPESKGDYPKFVGPIERQMWTCEWKDGEPPEEPPYPKACNYKYEVNVDFDELKGYIEKRKKQKKEIEKQNEKIKEIQRKAKEKAREGA